MKYHELTITKAKAGKRVGRGIAAGQGKTAGRGTKGQKARTGSSRKPGFAGGSNPLMQQLPKLPGFRSHRIKAENVYTGQLNELPTVKITAEVLAAAGLVSNAYVRIKLIQKGSVSKALNIFLPAASQKAIAAVQEAGGTFEKSSRLARPVTSLKSRAKTDK